MYEEHLNYVKDYFAIHGDVPPLNISIPCVYLDGLKDLISLHSSKELLKEKYTPIELIILMEADLLDEEGALRIVWYSLDKGITGAESYIDVYKHIIMGSNKRLINPMVTEKAQYYWNEKQKIVEEFTRQLEDDITVN